MATIANINVAMTASTKGFDKGINKASQKLGNFNKAQKKSRKRNVRLGGVVGSVIGALGVRELGRAADAWTEMNNKIRVVTSGTEDQENTMSKVLDTANKVRAPVTAVAAVFQRFAAAGKELGFTNDEALAMVETLFKIGVVGGTTAEEMRATLIQLSQGFGKNRLDGIELTSVLEQMLPVAQLLGKELGVPAQKLKSIATKGVITAKVIKDALTRSAGDIARKFGETTPTIAQQLDIIGNKWKAMVGAINEASSATTLFGKGLTFVGDIIDKITATSKRGGVFQLFKNLFLLGSDRLDASRGANRFFGKNNALSFLQPGQGGGMLGEIKEENSDQIVEQLKLLNEGLSNQRLAGRFS